MSAFYVCLDFTKSLVYSNCQNDRKCFFFRGGAGSRLCAMHVFYHICLFIISNEFAAVKKDPLEIQHSKLENSRLGFIESHAEKYQY